MVLMRGATYVRRGVIAYLMEAIPEQHAFATAQWEVEEDESLPLPEKYLLFEPQTLAHESGPMVGVSVSRGSRFERVDYDPSMGEQYFVNYTVRLVGAVFTPKQEDEQVPEDSRYQTIRYRDDLAAITRSALLTRPSMGQDAFYFQERTLVEDYMDPSPTSPNGIYAATFVFTFTLQVDESQYRDALGSVPASGVIINTALLPMRGE